MERARYNTEPYSNRSPPPNIILNRPTFGGHIISESRISIYTKYFIVPFSVVLLVLNEYFLHYLFLSIDEDQ